MNSNPEQGLNSVQHSLTRRNQRPHLPKPARVLEFPGASGHRQPRHGASDLVHSEEVDAIPELPSLHHRRERHHLSRPVGGTRHVHPLRLPQLLRPQLRRRRQVVVDHRDRPEP